MEENLKSRKRKFINLEDKIDLIRQIESGRKKCDVGKQYGLVSSTIHSIWKNRHNILQAFEQRGLKKKPKMCKPGQREIDQALLEWFYQQRNNNYLVSGPTLRNKAEEFARNLHLDEFVCTKSWLDRFKIRHKISLYGKVNCEGNPSSSETLHFNNNNSNNNNDKVNNYLMQF